MIYQLPIISCRCCFNWPTVLSMGKLTSYLFLLYITLKSTDSFGIFISSLGVSTSFSLICEGGSLSAPLLSELHFSLLPSPLSEPEKH